MTPVEKYFTAERFYCAIGVGIGITAIALATYFLLKVKQPFYTGMSYPFLVLGFFFLVICAGVYVRSPKDITRVEGYLQAHSDQLQKEELPRMDAVMRNFKVIIVVEILLIVAALVILLFTNMAATWKGVSAGVLILATLLLGFDYLADQRGSVYHQFLIQHVKTAE
jgi:polyferredoxin